MSIVIIDHRAKLPWLFQDFAFPHIVSVVVPSSARLQAGQAEAIEFVSEGSGRPERCQCSG